MRAACRLAILLASMAPPSWTCAQQSPSTPAPVEARTLDLRTPVRRALGTQERHAYSIALEAGQFLDAAVNQRGIDVLVQVFAPDGTRVAEVDSPNGANGDEPIALAAKVGGEYRIEVSPLGGASAGEYEIRINEILSPAAHAARLAELQRKRQAVVARLDASAIPVLAVEAGKGFADLVPLKHVFGHVRLVGLGEATHGSREFFQFKHRMLEFLVEEMGFRVFAIEASYAGCQDINDYIMGRAGDGAKALDSQGFWTWNTEEVRAMLDWMRAYNLRVPAARRVQFVGFDIQKNASGKAHLLDYLKRVAPHRVAETEAFFAWNDEDLVNAMFDSEGKDHEAMDKLARLRDQYNALFVFLELNADTLSAKSSPAEYRQMHEYARVLAQYFDVYSRIDGLRSRDLYMADNLRRLVAREPASTRFLVWAHNGHIGIGDAAHPTLGTELRRLFGPEYYALGFSFDHGRFQSRDSRPRQAAQWMLTEFTANPAPEGSVDWYLAQTGRKSFLVDFRSIGKDAAMVEWLGSPHPMRSIGSGYDPGFEARYFQPTIPGQEFDGLFFIDATTRARPNPSVKNVAPAPPAKQR
jgi:erythromycin esterase